MPVNHSSDLAAALLLGLLGSTHCVGMCGGISAALAFALPRNRSALRRHLLLGLYSCGRVSSYAAMGAMAGALSGTLAGEHIAVLAWMRVVAGALLVLMGMYLAGWSQALALLERAGHGVWRHVQTHAVRLLPIDSAPKALLAGAAWGWLPCGLVYSTLAWTASSASAPRGALLMLAFGIGTMPAVIASGVLAAQLRALLQRRGLRIIAGLLVIAFGVWTMTVVLLAGGHVQHHHH